MEERATGELVGRVGCLEPAGWPGFEIGWVLARPFWGKGYATEAARAALQFARDVLERDRIISLIRPGNDASIRVAAKLGATPDGKTTFFGAPTLVYAYPATVPQSGRAHHGAGMHPVGRTKSSGTAQKGLSFSVPRRWPLVRS